MGPSRSSVAARYQRNLSCTHHIIIVWCVDSCLSSPRPKGRSSSPTVPDNGFLAPQPKPRAETSRLLFPSVRFFIVCHPVHTGRLVMLPSNSPVFIRASRLHDQLFARKPVSSQFSSYSLLSFFLAAPLVSCRCLLSCTCYLDGR
jgi:hypothetical protein